MKIILAPDSFKGSLSSINVIRIMKQVIHDEWPSAEVIGVPMADGGEGTLDCILSISCAVLAEVSVHDPLHRIHTARYIRIPAIGTAVIEMAEASGLLLVEKQLRDPMISTTFGCGELITDALNNGLRKFIFFLGGSATNDAGAGLMAALGVKFYQDSILLHPSPDNLKNCTRIDFSTVDPRLTDCEVTIATDVNNPLCGKTGASYIFGPQKGADDEMVQKLDSILSHLADLIETELHVDFRTIQGTGAAGGLALGLLSVMQGKIVSGIETIIELTNFEKIIQNADLVFTGEGNTDNQTAFGKTPIGVARAAKKYNVPVICISGGLSTSLNVSSLSEIDAFFGSIPCPMSIEEAIGNSEKNLTSITRSVLRSLKIGQNLK